MPGDHEWIDGNYEIRKNIAHGIVPVGIETIALVVGKLGMIQQVSYRFLQDWRDKFLHVDWDASSQSLPTSDEESSHFE